MSIAGVDGCKYGWMMIKYQQGSYDFGLYKNMESLSQAHPDLQGILIDMPIGLSAANCLRTIEQKLRAELIPRQATVFNPPCRAALAATSYEAAKTINLSVEGKSLSIQSYFIQAKIKEVDDFLANKPPHLTLWESHPELCFKYLHPEEKVILSKKATAAGAEERLALIQRHDPQLAQLYPIILAQTLRKQVKKDDILDAMCLALVNKLATADQLQYLQDDCKIDERGLPIGIAYYRSQR